MDKKYCDPNETFKLGFRCYLCSIKPKHAYIRENDLMLSN